MPSLYLEPLNSSQNWSRLEIQILMMTHDALISGVSSTRWTSKMGHSRRSHAEFPLPLALPWRVTCVPSGNLKTCGWVNSLWDLWCHFGCQRPWDDPKRGNQGRSLSSSKLLTLPCYIFIRPYFPIRDLFQRLYNFAPSLHELSMVKPILGMGNNRSYIKGKTSKMGIQSSRIGVFARAWKEKKGENRVPASIASMSFWMVSRSTSLK